METDNTIMNTDIISLKYKDAEALLRNIQKDAEGLYMDKIDISFKGESRALQGFIELYANLVSALEIYHSIIDDDLNKALIGIDEIKQADLKASEIV